MKFNLFILKQILIKKIISGKHVDDFFTINHQALIAILIKPIQESNEKVNLLESKISILESNKI